MAEENLFLGGSPLAWGLGISLLVASGAGYWFWNQRRKLGGRFSSETDESDADVSMLDKRRSSSPARQTKYNEMPADLERRGINMDGMSMSMPSWKGVDFAGLKLPKGYMKLPDGNIKFPDGTLMMPDMRLRLPNGKIVMPDAKGNIKLPDGSFLLPDFSMRLPDNSLRLPDGRIEWPKWEPDMSMDMLVPDMTMSWKGVDLATLQLPNGYIRMPDGSIKFPDGSVMLPDMRLRLPNGQIALPDVNGYFKMPDGSLLMPDFSFKLPDGSLRMPELPDGSAGALVAGLPDMGVSWKGVNLATLQLPNGYIRMPDGSIKFPDGSVMLPDMRLRLPNGQIVLPDVNGYFKMPDGSFLMPDFSFKLPDGSVRMPELPDGSAGALVAGQWVAGMDLTIPGLEVPGMNIKMPTTSVHMFREPGMPDVVLARPPGNVQVQSLQQPYVNSGARTFMVPTAAPAFRSA